MYWSVSGSDRRNPNRGEGEDESLYQGKELSTIWFFSEGLVELKTQYWFSNFLCFFILAPLLHFCFSFQSTIQDLELWSLKNESPSSSGSPSALQRKRRRLRKLHDHGTRSHRAFDSHEVSADSFAGLTEQNKINIMVDLPVVCFLPLLHLLIVINLFP